MPPFQLITQLNPFSSTFKPFASPPRTMPDISQLSFLDKESVGSDEDKSVCHISPPSLSLKLRRPLTSSQRSGNVTPQHKSTIKGESCSSSAQTTLMSSLNCRNPWTYIFYRYLQHSLHTYSLLSLYTSYAFRSVHFPPCHPVDTVLYLIWESGEGRKPRGLGEAEAGFGTRSGERRGDWAVLARELATPYALGAS